MRRRLGLATASTLLAVSLVAAVPAIAAAADYETAPGFPPHEPPHNGIGFDDLVSVDATTGIITPLGLLLPDGASTPKIGITGYTTSSATDSNFDQRPGWDVVWGGDLGGSYGTDILLYDRETGLFRFSGVGRRIKIEGEMRCRPEDMVQAVYEDPDGEAVFCHNTEVADASLTFWIRRSLGAPFKKIGRLTSRGTGHFEYASRLPDGHITRRHITVP